MLPYNPDQVQLTSYYDKWLFDTMKRRTSDTATLMSIGAPAVGLAARISETTRLAQAKATPRVDEVVTHSLDLANAVQDTLNTMNQTLDRYPNLTGTWTICDFCVPLMAQAATSHGATGDKRPVISGMFTTPQTIAGIRNGSIDGVVELPYEVSSYVALDQALQFWARKKPFYPTQKVFTKGYSLKFLQPYMLTKANIGARGKPPLQGPDFVRYFNTKWRLEFGK
jgi:ABC-type sugar transport system substrate-binding protein